MMASFPADLEQAILAAYDRMGGTSMQPVAVAVRSSIIADEVAEGSFAGQQETYLNIQGALGLLHACKSCFASLYTDRAIACRAEQGLDSSRFSLSLAVQRMVRSDLAASGLVYTLDPDTGFRDVLLITSAYGLGETIAQGWVAADEYLVFKPTLKEGFRPILQKMLGAKECRLVYDSGGGRAVKHLPVPLHERSRFAIKDEEILKLAGWACVIEDHFSARAGRQIPMSIEWAKDGETGEIYIVQARSETSYTRKDSEFLERCELREYGSVLISGHSVGRKIAEGPVRIIRGTQHLQELEPGEVLVTDQTDPDWEPILKKAAAIITNRGAGRSCHAARLSRELGIPAVIGTHNATEILSQGQVVTVSCGEGEVGYVYEGRLPFDIKRVNGKGIPRPRTQVMMDVSNFEQAFAWAAIPNDGVGVARLERIIANDIKVHPLALLEYEKLDSVALKAEIQQITAGYSDKPQFFVDKLAQGVAMIAGAFYPKDVVVRLSDFKSNEWANLVGGRKYEPVEQNPIIGFRGASRYYNPRYQSGFALECRALKKVRDEMGLRNIKIMVPFCRTIEEACRVHHELEKHGLKRGKDGLEIYLLCEVPSNVTLAEDFSDLFDAFVIGTDDLTQLILGVDRDSELVSPFYDERNLAVKKTITHLIRAARARGAKVGMIGQAASEYPEFIQFLVEQGIDSISVKPDSVLKTTMAILEQEKGLKK